MESSQNDERRRRAYRSIYNAAREVIVTAVFTLTPVWAGALLSLLFQEVPSFWLAFSANIAKGDLFLLATAAMAPLMLYISIRPGTLPKPLTIHFPGGWLFIIILVVLFGGIAILFSIKRTAELADTSIRLDQSLFLRLSVISYLVSIALALIVTTIKYSIDDMKPEEIFRTDTLDFIERWRRRIKR